MASPKRRCLGITKNLNRCSREGYWLCFCQDHNKQPIIWLSFLIFTVVAGTASIYSAFFSNNNNVTNDQLNISNEIDNYAVSCKFSGQSKNQKYWLNASYELFKKQQFEVYRWIDNGKYTLEIINLSNCIPKYVYSKGISTNIINEYFVKILKDNGLLVKDIEVNVKKRDEIPGMYKIVFKSDIHDYAEWNFWVLEIEEFLQKNGYSIQNENQKDHSPTILTVYPPWIEANKIIELISNSKIIKPNHYLIFEHDEIEENTNFLQSIEGNKKGFNIHAFTPLKWMTGKIVEGNFRIIVTNPKGEIYSCNFKQDIEAEFNKQYPNDFEPVANKIIDGEYTINGYLDSGKIIKQRCLKKSSQLNCALTSIDEPVYKSN